jgi:ubiquinone/menaquinone biosynthesis C-methylase UbiE
MNTLDKHHQVIFMNFGYSEPGEKIMLESEDEKNRYSLQLYHHLIKMVDLTDKDIVDVGSGRGGGLYYIARTCSASSMIGIDREKSFIDFSRKYFKHRNLYFIKGDAQKLPLKNNSCDILLNVESSHRYGSMEQFLTEVNRILRPGGYFLFADFRYPHEWPDIIELFNNSGLKVLSEKDITSNIMHSLDLDSERRTSLVKRYAPMIMQKGILNFTGAKGTETYNYFLARKYTYKSFKLQKQDFKCE